MGVEVEEVTKMPTCSHLPKPYQTLITTFLLDILVNNDGKCAAGLNKCCKIGQNGAFSRRKVEADAETGSVRATAEPPRGVRVPAKGGCVR